MGFFRALEHGQKVEDELAAILSKNYTVTTTREKKCFSGYDLECTDNETGETLKIEVKVDSRAITSHLIAVELNKTKDGVIEPSGLSNTQADYYAYKIQGLVGFWCVLTTDLKKLVEADGVIKISGGDNQSSNLALVPFKEYKKYATHLQ